ncbi:hypothetical protein I4U23_007659 [Adineta vaga]|nr:hypothetical protein I4U23_007659 [Adineta vaga]
MAILHLLLLVVIVHHHHLPLLHINESLFGSNSIIRQSYPLTSQSNSFWINSKFNQESFPTQHSLTINTICDRFLLT